MTCFVETDFLLALLKDDDWLKGRAEMILEERTVVTSPLSYLELLFVLDGEAFDFERLYANLLELVPVGSDDERQLVLKAAGYVAEGLTPFDAYHAATAETRGLPICSSDRAYDGVDPERVPLEPTDSE